MATFGLVHGAWHGAWCWTQLSIHLETYGHRVVAMDLPAGDAGAGCAEYACVVATAIGDPDAIVVGHSLGGLTIPLVPARHHIYLCALIPLPAAAMSTRDAETFMPEWHEYARRGQIALGDGSTTWKPDVAVDAMYHDCDPRDAALAAASVRPQHWKAYTEVTPLTSWPDTERTSILCTQERCISPAWSRAQARDVLGVEAIEMDGGHSPFLSRPAELAEILHALT